MSVFVPAKFGYKELLGDIVKGSLNDIAASLGYNSDQTYTYFGDSDENFQVKNVCVEVFTSNIIFVLADSTKGPLKKSKVNYFMRNFSVKSEFRAPNVEDILRSGIANKSLDINFLARVLKISNPALNGFFTVKSISLTLIFEGGYLADFIPSDGLNQWGKLINELNPTLARDYEKQATMHWGNKPSNVLREVNTQADAFANTPNGFSNGFTSHHMTNYGLIDFYTLMICHYNRPTTVEEFEALNHDRYTRHEVEGRQVFSLRNFNYTFSENGQLSSVELTEP